MGSQSGNEEDDDFGGSYGEETEGVRLIDDYEELLYHEMRNNFD